jgi:GNAT superfamily N-acetyltransferase
VHVVEVDPYDASAFDAWYANIVASSARIWPGEAPWQRVELFAEATDHRAERAIDLAAVDPEGRTVGSAWLDLPLLDNRHLAIVFAWVDPAHERRGAGGALLAEAERLSRADGRTLLTAHQEHPLAHPGPMASERFARGHGFSLGQVEIRRDLALPPDHGRLDALEAACAPYAAGYRILGWQGRWPDQYVEDRLVFGRAMSTDAPMGEVALEEEHWDEARLRQTEEKFAGQNRTVLGTATLHEASGRLVAFSELAIPGGAPEKAYQQDTLVLGPHRGHRLGTLVKIANLRALTEISPKTTSIATWNARENDPMIAVNEALGCEAVGLVNVWQKVL